MNKQWEYAQTSAYPSMLPGSDREFLLRCGDMGDAGWELVSVIIDPIGFFKRIKS